MKWRAVLSCSQGVGLAIKRSQVQFPAISISCNNSGQVVHTHTHMLLSSSSIIWYWPNGDNALQLGMHYYRPVEKLWQPYTTAGFILLSVTIRLTAERQDQPSPTLISSMGLHRFVVFRIRQEGMAIANGMCVGFCNQCKAHFGLP